MDSCKIRILDAMPMMADVLSGAKPRPSECPRFETVYEARDWALTTNAWPQLVQAIRELVPSLESPAGPPRVVPAWTPYTDLVAAVQDERAVSVLIAMPRTTHNPERYWPVAIQSDGCRAAFNTEPLPTITPDPTRLRELGDCYKPMPVGYWGPYRYIVMTSPRLQAGPQTITTIDISDEADIYVNQAMQAFVCIPDEGHLTALCCDGHGKWVHDAILSVELVRGDADQAREQWEAEMETSEGLGIL